MGLLGSKQSQSTPNYQSPAFTYQNMIKHITEQRFQQQYKMQELLGKGSYAEVRKAMHINTGVVRAVKIIDRVKHSKIQTMLLNQFNILKELDHPNIMKIYAIYEENRYYYIVSELCHGRELYDILKQNKYLDQKDTIHIFYQLVCAVGYLHSRNIMHRDLKPQNIMYDNQTRILKLIDFGSALQFDSDSLQSRRRVGTTYYIAPEVIQRCYNSKCDMWSLGVILYMALSGEPPFKGKNDEEILMNIKKGQYNFKKNIWEVVSLQAKMLITQLFTYDPIKRPSIVQVFKSDWIQRNKQQLCLPQNQQSLVAKALINMNKFKKTKSNNIQGGLLVFVVNFIQNAADQAQMQKSFMELDLNGDGLLSLEQITIGLQKYLKVQQKQARLIGEAIFGRIDTNNSGVIDYSQFLVAASNMEIVASKQNLQLAFNCMDKNKNGSLSAEQLKQRLGGNIMMQDYQKMLKQFKLNSKGEITKQQFIRVMTKLSGENQGDINQLKLKKKNSSKGFFY